MKTRSSARAKFVFTLLNRTKCLNGKVGKFTCLWSALSYLSATRANGRQELQTYATTLHFVCERRNYFFARQCSFSDFPEFHTLLDSKWTVISNSHWSQSNYVKRCFIRTSGNIRFGPRNTNNNYISNYIVTRKNKTFSIKLYSKRRSPNVRTL